MMVKLETVAEQQAEKAEGLDAFSGIKLLNIKKNISDLLSLIGRGDIFDEYTRHDISHINKMLNMLEWLIPKQTQEIMSPADWLMTVLGIYFHDLGMLVTKSEYHNRKQSGFEEFCEKVLFEGNNGKDYQAKVEQLSEEAAQKFLYQEFVRKNHAERIRYWIGGEAPNKFGITENVVEQINSLLQPLSPVFRRDLGIICESHHLNDLNDFQKYKVWEPYGDSDQETANLQYAAILLRTTDLLHMTSDRTPSVLFHTINPSDPLSQKEWAKQKAVRSVRSQMGLNREGKPDNQVPRDTIEVFARFTDKNGFFGLTSFLQYVEQQLQQSYDWVQAAKQEKSSKYSFPWRFIDDCNIETQGFSRNNLKFTFDQAKILDLLTGHTLYNDIQVVVRELIQNSIDAIRVQRLIDSKASNGQNQNDGQVVITWDSSQRLLSVRDNGTGMTQDIIERHLLKVGSSRYQHEDFKRKYPNFSPISRFGIGLLSSFMIADEVEIITCHEEEEKARLLTLRSVHGKYLIQLVDKDDNSLQDILPHGTSIKLKVRQSADLDDILKIVRKWIVFPDCDVLVIEDDRPPVKVGFSSPKESLTAILTDLGLLGDSKRKKKIKVEERTINGLTLAYALECQDYFQDWEFLTFDMLKVSLGDDLIEDNPIKNYLRGDDLNKNISREVNLGICVQGVRVEFTTPGFNEKSIIAIANSQGSNAPKTDVARSGFEVTPGREKMLEAIYQIYCNHIKSEITELQKRQFSLTKAADEAQYLLKPLIEVSFDKNKATDLNLLNNAIEEIPFLIIEKDRSRSIMSPQELLNANSFWTIESRLFDLANILISEINSSISLSSVAKTFYLDQKLYLPDSDLYFIVNYISSQRNEYLLRSIFENREVDKILVYSKEKRVDLRWIKTKKRINGIVSLLF